MSADDHPKTDTNNEASEAASHPALFATIHHKSEDRPDGYSDDDIGELNQLANGKSEAPRKEKRTALLASAAALVLVAGVVGGAWAIKAWEGSRSPTEPSSAPTTTPESEPYIPEPVETYSTPGVTEVRGVSVGQLRGSVAAAIEERDMILIDNGGGPILEMHFALPAYESASSLYIATPQCFDELRRRENMTPDEANSLAALRMADCKLAGRVFYDADDRVKAFYFTPAGLDIDRLTLKDFAQAIVDNTDVERLESEQRRLVTLGFDGFCEEYLGTALQNVRVKVSECGFMRAQFELSPTDTANFR